MGHDPDASLYLITQDPEQELYDLTAWVTAQRLMGRIPDDGYASLMKMIEDKARELNLS